MHGVKYNPYKRLNVEHKSFKENNICNTIFLHTHFRYLYYSDWGSSPAVIRTDLDGGNPLTIMTSSTVSNPNGLCIHSNKLYVSDSNFNSRIQSSFIASYDLDTGATSVILSGDRIGIPFGLVSDDHTLFYADWVDLERETGMLVSYDLQHGVKSIVKSSLTNPTGVMLLSLHQHQGRRGNAASDDFDCFLT